MNHVMKFAHPTNATPGPCALCPGRASKWSRTTAECGLVVAARACDAHEAEVDRLLRVVTIEEYARSIHRSARSRRAEQAHRKAGRLRLRAARLARASASLAGASSATHALALHAAYAAFAADALEALSECLAGV